VHQTESSSGAGDERSSLHASAAPAADSARSIEKPAEKKKRLVKPHRIEGHTRVVCVFGDPVEHSLSPRMHNAAYRELGLDYVYVAFKPAVRRFSDAVQAMRTLGIVGANVTVPFKQAAVTVCDRVTETVSVVGAANTLYFDHGKIVGENTDGLGFASALGAHGFRIRGKRVLVIGAGGAARAVVWALTEYGAADIVIANRTPSKAKKIAKLFRSHLPGVQYTDLEVLDDFDFLETRQLVVNATSVGLGGKEFLDYSVEATPDDCVHFDLVYAEEPTPFLRMAHSVKRPTIDGRHMLVHQGAAAFKLFTGRRAPVEVMAKAIGIKVRTT
jgi:shikimate dehydrogenase